VLRSPEALVLLEISSSIGSDVVSCVLLVFSITPVVSCCVVYHFVALPFLLFAFIYIVVFYRIGS